MLRRRAWVLLIAVVLIHGCGGGGGRSNHGNDPSTTSYFGLLQPTLVRWKAGTIPIAIDTTHVPSDWKPAYLGYIGTAYGDWLPNLLDVKIKYYVYPKDTTEPKVSIRWVDKITDAADSNAIALTRIKIDPSNKHRLLGFDVQIGLHDVDGRRLTDQEVLVATAHEIGHTLGVMCHSPNQYDVMYAKAFNAYPTLRDLNTIEKLYASTPYITDRHALVLVRGPADN